MRIGHQGRGAVGIDADMVKHRGRVGLGVGLGSIGDHLFAEIDPAPARAKDRRGAADPSRAPVGQKAVQRPPVAAQHRGGDIGYWIGAQARHQILDKPGGGQGRVTLQVHDHVIAGQTRGHFGAAFSPVLRG